MRMPHKIITNGLHHKFDFLARYTQCIGRVTRKYVTIGKTVRLNIEKSEHSSIFRNFVIVGVYVCNWNGEIPFRWVF